MAKVKTASYVVENAAKDRLSLQFEVTVDAGGVFAIGIPDFLADSAQRLAVGHERVSFERPRVHARVTGRDLATLEAFVKDVMRDQIAVDEVTELVIRYGSHSAYSGFLTVDGAMLPNAQGVEGYDTPGADVGRWVGGLNGNSFDTCFRIGLVARAMVRRSYVSPSGTKVVYDRASDGHDGLGEWGRRLNGVVGLLPPGVESQHAGGSGVGVDFWRDVPYGEDAARFFFEALMGIAKLANRLEAFLGDETAVMRAVAKGGSMLMLENGGG